MEQKNTTRRETAKITSVSELLQGTYVVREGWESNYIQTQKRTLSRINIIGTVVSKESLYQFNIDDGTGTILITDFNQLNITEKIKVGDPVLIIGRPRQANGTLFIATEVIQSKQLQQEPLWLVYRKQELEKIQQELDKLPEIISNKNNTIKEKKDEIITSVESNTKTEKKLNKKTDAEIDDLLDVYTEEEKKQVVNKIKPIIEKEKKTVTGDDIIDFIRKKDSSSGCLIDDIVEYFGDIADDIVTTLISMGEIYEIKPGRVKVLE